MTDVTLVLPFSLPPPPLAPDLARHLKAPALAALLSKTTSSREPADEGGIRHLPHERWLARFLGGDAARPAFAHAAMRGFGLDPAGGNWFIVTPGHIEIARSHLLLNDPARLALSEAHSRALCEAARPYVEELGMQLVYGDAGAWFLRADAWQDLETASPEAAAGLDISFFLPAGDDSAAYRKLQNEIQMLWHDHPANREREAQRLPAVNAFWPWAAGGASASAPMFTSGASSWMDALAASTGGGKAAPGAAVSGTRTIWCAELQSPALAEDWSAWIVAMQALENDRFAPLLASLRAGEVRRITLVLTGRDKLVEVTTTALAQRKFWRRATLDTLLS